jgi:hypothetical protein
MSKKTVKDQTQFPDKLLKLLPDGWAEGANSMKEDELKKVVVDCNGNIYIINQAKSGDDKLNGARELAKDLSAPYRDARNAQQAKIEYALWLLSERGVDLDHTEAAE